MVWNLIVTGDKMSNEDAYAIVKTLVEKNADIVAVHKEAESFSLDNQVQERSPIPFHPGALKYFGRRGSTVWAQITMTAVCRRPRSFFC